MTKSRTLEEIYEIIDKKIRTFEKKITMHMVIYKTGRLDTINEGIRELKRARVSISKAKLILKYEEV